MATEIRTYAVTVPAGTSQASAFSQAITFPAREVSQINIRVPPGPRGQVGFAIGTGGMPIIPAGPGVFLVADDQEIEWPLDDVPNSGSWEVFAYNTGNYPHTLYVTFLLDLVSNGSGILSPVSPDTLSQSVSLGGVATAAPVTGG